MPKGIRVSSVGSKRDNPLQETIASSHLSPKNRIEGSGSVTSDVGGNVINYQIQHNLGYAPVHLVFFNPGNTNAVLHPGTASWIDAMTSTTWGLMDNFTFIVTVTETYLQIDILGVPNTTYYYKYYIFVEPAK